MKENVVYWISTATYNNFITHIFFCKRKFTLQQKNFRNSKVISYYLFLYFFLYKTQYKFYQHTYFLRAKGKCVCNVTQSSLLPESTRCDIFTLSPTLWTLFSILVNIKKCRNYDCILDIYSILLKSFISCNSFI